MLSLGYIVISINKTKLTYNNEMSYDELISYRYTDEELYNLYLDIRNEVLGWKISKLFDFVKKKKIECARYITDDYRYIILESETNNKLFIFFSGRYVINNVYYVQQNFLERGDFDAVQVGETRLSEINDMDRYQVLSPWSHAVMTEHIVKEGIYHIIYKDKNLPYQNGDYTADYVVDKMVFYRNDDLLEKWLEHYFFVPYILPMDKQ